MKANNSHYNFCTSKCYFSFVQVYEMKQLMIAIFFYCEKNGRDMQLTHRLFFSIFFVELTFSEFMCPFFYLSIQNKIFLILSECSSISPSSFDLIINTYNLMNAKRPVYLPRE